MNLACPACIFEIQTRKSVDREEETKQNAQVTIVEVSVMVLGTVGVTVAFQASGTKPLFAGSAHIIPPK